jgi:hypothetical protein
MKTSTRILIFLFLALLPGAPKELRAQETSKSFNLRFLSWEPLKEERVYYQDKSGYHPVDIRTNKRSSVYEFSGKLPVIFYRDVKDAKNKVQKQEIARAAIPDGFKNPLLILFRNSALPEEGHDYDVIAVDDDVSRFPFGSYRIFNLTKATTLGGQIGSGRFVLLPQKADIVSPSQATRENIPVEFDAIKANTAIPWKKTTWTHDPELRTLVFVFESPGPQGPVLSLKSITENNLTLNPASSPTTGSLP